MAQYLRGVLGQLRAGVELATTRAGEGGSGLGLALAQEIVQRYGGAISLQSREGVGTTFTLSFPAINGDAPGASSFTPAVEPLRVLAVEDEPEVLDLVRAMLTHPGHSVITAASGREALTLDGHAGLVEAAAFSPSDARLVTGGWDTTALVWDLSRRLVPP